MKGEEGKEEQVVPEVKAAWADLERLMKRLLEVIADPEPSPALRKIYAELVEKWLGIALSENVPKAFWEEILELTERAYWQTIKANLEMPSPNIMGALETAEHLVESLSGFAILLGEIPPEEEEAPTEEPIEEPPVEEERPWEELGITEEMWNCPLRRVLVGSEEMDKSTMSRVGQIAGSMSADLKVHVLDVRAGPTLRRLNEVQWEPGAIRGIGKKLIQFAWRKFYEADYCPPVFP